jgi:hypothetical protein
MLARFVTTPYIDTADSSPRCALFLLRLISPLSLIISFYTSGRKNPSVTLATAVLQTF